MKRYIRCLMTISALCFCGCKADVLSEPEVKDLGALEVVFSVGGEEVRSLDLPSISHEIVVDVTMNNQDVFWTPVSNQNWCKIIEDEHRGDGQFTVVIDANGNLAAREAAQISFVAGKYSKPMLNINHNGTVFLLSQLYAISVNSENSTSISVTTLEGLEWDMENTSWISATKGASKTENGITTTVVDIKWEKNVDASRYGNVGFVKKDQTSADAFFSVWQYGTDISYDGEGQILVGAQNAKQLEIRVPKQTVKGITMPSWISANEQDNADGTMSYMLQFSDNPSDAQQIRQAELLLSMLAAVDTVSVPLIRQEYYNVPGLLTGPGLVLFAKTWNEGGDVSQWYINGVPTVVSDIDLKEITNWIPIGTEDRPWIGVFDGNGKKLLNLNTSCPLFGYCKDATIKNLSIDSSCSFNVTEEYGVNLFIASLAGDIKNTLVENCNNSANVTLDASTEEVPSTVYVAGLVAKSDEMSRIIDCTNNGNITATASCTPAPNKSNNYCFGGIAAYSLGRVEKCFNDGDITQQGTVYRSCVGGIVGLAGPVDDSSLDSRSTSAIINNVNTGSIVYGTPRGEGDAGRWGYMGGVTSYGFGEISGNISEGDITSTSTVKSVIMGGVVGYVNYQDVKLSNNSFANSSTMTSNGKARYCYMGGLIGFVEKVTLTLDKTSDSGVFEGTITTTGISDGNGGSIIAMGGLIGFSYNNATVCIKGAKMNGHIYVSPSENFEVNRLMCGGLVGGWDNAGCAISNSQLTGGIHVVPNSTKFSTKLYIGGALGYAKNGASVSSSSFSGVIEWDANSAKSNGFGCITGGMIGNVESGSTSVASCTVTGVVETGQYNNTAYNPSAENPYVFNSVGGVVGAFGASLDYDASTCLTVENCNVNDLTMNAARGCIGGVVGFARNTTIDNCHYTGSNTDNTNSNIGGIVSIGRDVQILKCTAKTDMVGQGKGSWVFRAGGIVGHVMGNSLIDNCAYYGTLQMKAPHETLEDHYGGIAGLVENNTVVIKDSRYGGFLNDVAINEGNIMKYISNINSKDSTEVSPATIENCGYWNGK